jgi:hypothetical protein
MPTRVTILSQKQGDTHPPENPRGYSPLQTQLRIFDYDPVPGRFEATSGHGG